MPRILFHLKELPLMGQEKLCQAGKLELKFSY
jgi:hypothetical protein